MKQAKGRIARLLLAVFMVIAVSGAVMTVSAAGTPTLSAGSKTIYMNGVGNIELKGVESFEQLKGLKYSNSKVAYITPGNISGNKIPLYIYATKPGKTKISFTAKNKTLSFMVNVLKYQNPCASYMFGSRDCAAEYKKSTVASIKKPGGKCQISIKAKSGWKIDSILAITNKGRSEKIKNGATIGTNVYNSVNVTYMNKKTKAMITTTLFWE